MATESKRHQSPAPAVPAPSQPTLPQAAAQASGVDEAELRAQERRAREAKAREEAASQQVNKQITEIKAGAAKAKEDEAAKAKLGQAVADLRTKAEYGRKSIAVLKEQIRAAEELVGNLDGSIITANDVARRDPTRALEILKRASALFEYSKLEQAAKKGS